jgi:hypothetical protein
VNAAEYITAWATVGATVVSIVAAVIAGRSAGASERSAVAAERALRRGAVRELVSACHEVVAEDLRLHSLVVDILSEYTAAGVFAGQSGGSVETKLKASVEAMKAKSVELSAEAQKLSADPAPLFDAPDHEVDQIHGRVERARVGVRGLREKLERDLANIRQENAASRDRILR